MVSDQVKGILAKSNTQYGKFNMNAPLNQEGAANNTEFTIDAVYTELIQLRQTNRVLETRIKQLELQNFNMTRSGFQGGPQGIRPQQNMGTKNVEPNRPIFDSNGQSLPSNVQSEDDDEYDDEDDYDDEEEGESSQTIDDS